METGCPFANGCPFSGCKTREEIVNKLEQLREDPVWQPLLAKMETCPVFTRCPMSNCHKGKSES